MSWQWKTMPKDEYEALTALSEMHKKAKCSVCGQVLGWHGATYFTDGFTKIENRCSNHLKKDNE